MPEEVSKKSSHSGERSGFVMVPRIVIRDRRLSPLDFLVYAHVRDVAGEGGACWQSMSSIGRVLGRSRRTVQRAVRALIRLGYLEEEQRDGRTTFLRVVDVWAANAAALRGGPDTSVQGTRDTDVLAGRTPVSTDQEPGSEISSRTRSQDLSRAGTRVGRIEEALSLGLALFASADPSACSQRIVRRKLEHFLALSSLDPVTVMTEIVVPELEWAARRRSVTRLDERNQKRVEPVANRVGYVLGVLDGTRVRDVAGVPPINWKRAQDDGADIVDGALGIDRTLLEPQR